MADPFSSQINQFRNSGGFNDSMAGDRALLERYLAGGGDPYKSSVRRIAGVGAATPDAARSALNLLNSRNTERQGLISGIEALPGQYQTEVDIMKQEAGQAEQAGVKNTRQNYNRRGLLYSGLRQGGEQQVRQGVAGQLASGVAGATRDYQNLLDKRKQAVSSLYLQNRQEALNNANLAFENTQRNNIARMQAFQQFGEGLGSLAGTWYGGGFSRGSGGGGGTGGGGGSFDTPFSGGSQDFWSSNPYSR